MTARTVETVLEAPRPHWVGDGFLVRPLFGRAAFTAAVSPFLMFDWAAPVDFPPSPEPRGVGPHPHRGFETVTIVHDGAVDHRDSAGHTDSIGAGDVQWMTAGSGVVHEEFHGRSVAELGGRVSMAQLWVNLPAAHKMTRPRYQPILARDIPVMTSEGLRARVIAGPWHDAGGAAVHGPAKTFTPLAVWDIALDAGARLEQPLPEGWNVLVSVLSGDVVIAGRAVTTAQVAVAAHDGDRLLVTAGAGGAKLLVLAGEPIGEPIAAHGPFVMNTHEEIRAAIADYAAGRMGDLDPR
ncbi:MAG: pirin family protein [Siculibacillus sp.]|nr:pirin family protein [Siculibacillus sp.]